MMFSETVARSRNVPRSSEKDPWPLAVVESAEQAAERTNRELRAAVAEMAPVSLQELDLAQLHDRQESKVILRIGEIADALSSLADHYFVMDHQGERLQGYCNEYFDSAELRSYHEHHNQRGRRHKLRYRTYINSDLTYFEVKRNFNGRTVKERQRSRRPQGALWAEDGLFCFKQTGLPPSQLIPSLQVDYKRILLVKRDFSERVTIDLNLTFSSAMGATETRDLAICEFKQPSLDLRSPAMTALARRPQNFSKYCMGLASCDPHLRRNRFKKVFRNLAALDAQFTERELAAA